LKDLSVFVVTEHRIRRLEEFVRDTFPEYVLREREDTRVRYEVSGPELRISEIFARIEDHKQSLLLADYGVSQTSLEQVFNMHAAKAERLKEDRIVPDKAESLKGDRIVQATPLADTIITQDEEGSIEMYC
jgi:hypothetical protein